MLGLLVKNGLGSGFLESLIFKMRIKMNKFLLIIIRDKKFYSLCKKLNKFSYEYTLENFRCMNYLAINKVIGINI